MAMRKKIVKKNARGIKRYKKRVVARKAGSVRFSRLGLKSVVRVKRVSDREELNSSTIYAS